MGLCGRGGHGKEVVPRSGGSHTCLKLQQSTHCKHLMYSQTEDQLERDGDDGGIVFQDTHIGVKVRIEWGLDEIG